jgi:hypothetical protein
MQFEKSPPLAVPLRFFLTAPLFALAAAVLLSWQGPAALASRWSPSALALTHLLTLGFLMISMAGALLQILAVVTGIVVPRLRLTSIVVHAALTAGTVLLVAGFWLAQPLLFRLALPLLALALLWLISACALGIWRSGGSSAILAAIRLALAALAITVLLGLSMGSAFGWQFSLQLTELTRLHVVWGLLGWISLLMIGVAYQVVPMFQVTPSYSPRLMRWLAPALFTLLLGWSALQAVAEHWQIALEVPLAAVLALFPLVTLHLQSRRKRSDRDITVLFWRAGMLSLLGCIMLWGLARFLPAAGVLSSPVLLGTLFLLGFAWSAVNGMLYKIVPFLVWYHLQSQVTARGIVPNVKLILPERRAFGQWLAHLAALMLLLAAIVWPGPLTQAAAAALAISSGWLWLNLYRAASVYRQVRQKHSQHFPPT